MLAAVMVAALLWIFCAGAYLGSVVVARHQAQAGADLAAIAAAAALPAGVAAACQRASQVGREMRADRVDCEVDDLDVVVRVEVAAAFRRWGLGQVRAAARAGPESTRSTAIRSG